MKFKALPNCASYIQLKLRRVADGGDHDVAICEVIGTGVWDNSSNTVKWLDEDNSENQVALDSSSALYTRQLREEMII
jgi:flavin reductase (DIM6/NTAB) family NADH-FMN oxidoreductase RutF